MTSKTMLQAYHTACILIVQWTFTPHPPTEIETINTIRNRRTKQDMGGAVDIKTTSKSPKEVLLGRHGLLSCPGNKWACSTMSLCTHGLHDSHTESRHSTPGRGRQNVNCAVFQSRGSDGGRWVAGLGKPSNVRNPTSFYLQ
jgi:hypothetical protein